MCAGSNNDVDGVLRLVGGGGGEFGAGGIHGYFFRGTAAGKGAGLGVGQGVSTGNVVVGCYFDRYNFYVAREIVGTAGRRPCV